MDKFLFYEQYNRMKRFLERIKNQNRDQIEYEDDMWAFFQNAWHLKDWIENDETFRKEKNIIKNSFLEDEIKQWPNLQICRDIACGTKHLKLKLRDDFKKKIGINHITKEMNKDVKLSLGGLSNNVEYNYRFKSTDGTEYNVLDLANNIVKNWNAIIDKIVAPSSF